MRDNVYLLLNGIFDGISVFMITKNVQMGFSEAAVYVILCIFRCNSSNGSISMSSGKRTTGMLRRCY